MVIAPATAYVGDSDIVLEVHADPGDVPVWKRSNGFLTLSIRPGWDHDENHVRGYPFGTFTYK